MCFVRLACVRHAASVHPEPGSNSQIKICFLIRNPEQISLHWLFPFRLYFLKLLFKDCDSLSSLTRSFNSNHLVCSSEKSFIMNFQGCLNIQFSRFCFSLLRLSKLSFRASAKISLSNKSALVNTFF